MECLKLTHSRHLSIQRCRRTAVRWRTNFFFSTKFSNKVEYFLPELIFAATVNRYRYTISASRVTLALIYSNLFIPCNTKIIFKRYRYQAIFFIYILNRMYRSVLLFSLSIDIFSVVFCLLFCAIVFFSFRNTKLLHLFVKKGRRALVFSGVRFIIDFFFYFISICPLNLWFKNWTIRNCLKFFGYFFRSKT